MNRADDFVLFFQKATNFHPFPYQMRLALSDEPPQFLHIPTGLGKTAAIVVSWVWRRMFADEETRKNTPRRLVYCLPMRVLVEQTYENCLNWLINLNLLGDLGEDKISVHMLMGGVEDLNQWAGYPDENLILIGTQDMLLSRALNRGYALSRFQWPIHFAFLHNDAFWVFDEVQLMGPGITTSVQLEAFRQAFSTLLNSRSLWASATLSPNWFVTPDFNPESSSILTLEDADLQIDIVQKRYYARKKLIKASVSLSRSTAKKGAKAYIANLLDYTLNLKDKGPIIIILNTVDRAQKLYLALKKKIEDQPCLLIHSRFRPPDRKVIEQQLHHDIQNPNAIVIATQAIEAGIDISCRTLITELAPWASMIQRFGRCNRYGEFPEAEIHWIYIEGKDDSQLSLPYSVEDLDMSYQILSELENASPASLPPTPDVYPNRMIIRKKDLMELFNTDPDLFGYHIDVDMYIRDSDESNVFCFWRDFDDPNEPLQNEPTRDELCSAPISAIRQFLKQNDSSAFMWDHLLNRWVRIRVDSIRPGMTLLIPASSGGYSGVLGFYPDEKSMVQPVSNQIAQAPEAFSSDHQSYLSRYVDLPTHLLDVENEAESIAQSLNLSPGDIECLKFAGRWHDIGKAHPVFQKTLTGCEIQPPVPDRLWAKSPCRGHHKRRYFRHELASALAWLEHHGDHPHADLIAYLIAAHHGKIRMSIRAMPDESPPCDAQRRFARGIWEGDTLPPLHIPGRESVPATTLKLDIMEIGLGPHGPSWTERTQKLLNELGPFRLAFLEALLRIADWRASQKEQNQNASGVDDS